MKKFIGTILVTLLVSAIAVVNAEIYEIEQFANAYGVNSTGLGLSYIVASRETNMSLYEDEYKLADIIYNNTMLHDDVKQMLEEYKFIHNVSAMTMFDGNIIINWKDKKSGKYITAIYEKR